MYWLLVLIAGLLEVVWASALKHADSLFDWIGIFLLIAVSFLMLIRSYKNSDGCRIHRFVGIGTVGTYVTGVILGESFSIGQIFFLALLLSGILGMKVFTKETETRGEH